jgi:hypothetical protein
MRQRIEQILSEMKGEIVVPTQEQIDRAEAAAIVALGDRVNDPIYGGTVTIAALAILLNRDWILNAKKT